MTYEALEVKQDGAIAWLTLNRPHVLNAQSCVFKVSHESVRTRGDSFTASAPASRFSRAARTA